jgi:hypothetical protein
MGFTYYLDNKLLDLVFSNTSYTVPSTLYIGLSTTAPTQAGGNFKEPSGNGYARVAVTNNSTNWPAASNGAKSNANAITFPQATGSWGTVTHFGIFDAATSGNLLAWGALSQSKAISAGDTPYFAAGSLTLNLS